MNKIHHTHWQAVIERYWGVNRNGNRVCQYVLLGYAPHEGILKDDLLVMSGALLGLPIYTFEELSNGGGLSEDVLDYVAHILDKSPLVLELQHWWKKRSNRYKKQLK